MITKMGKISALLLLMMMATLTYAQDAAPEDACASEPLEEYNLGMRIGAMFIILGTSSIGVFFPMIMEKISPYSEGSLRDWILTVGKFFGTGVILATAFVHMLPDGFNQFASPCLTEGWLSYGAFAGVFCMLASFALQLLEIGTVTHLKNLEKQSKKNNDTAPQAGKHDVESGSTTQQSIISKNSHDHQHLHEHVHTSGLLEHEDAHRHVATYMLELGIVMHSVLIGLTLATTSQAEFTTLLIALVFHQFFEGIALGTRLVKLNNVGWIKLILMGLLFTLTTPIGSAIGIGIRSSFNANSYSAVLASAILDSLSAGILLYNGYVSLMSAEMNLSDAFHNQSAIKKIVCFASLYIGAGLMSLIGEWA
ncbi:Zinc/iron permease [Halteromyces radiatus]|uniref:Zinc/iron permease n=1 Tax=Halteromyces radiatus TaxID=101107 RepID=UPI0022200BA6|nr:Zinc/iron permease [Halteromyces radiatus]KAI8088822.1 Zinc/iron permease [Halteromyces radiatus]